MTGDLLVITPSRGRPASFARLLDAVHATATAVTHVHVGVDEDDPALEDYRRVCLQGMHRQDQLHVGPRKGLVAWTNLLARSQVGRYTSLASLGDDHIPRTKGWDTALIRAIEDMGGTGIAYPWDGTREDIPEAPVVSADIVATLGWFFEPSLSHWYGDEILGVIGRATGCLRHCRAVWVEHVHPATGRTAPDRTNADQGTKITEDKAAYMEWRENGMAAAVATVRELRERVPAPA